MCELYLPIFLSQESVCSRWGALCLPMLPSFLPSLSAIFCFKSFLVLSGRKNEWQWVFAKFRDLQCQTAQIFWISRTFISQLLTQSLNSLICKLFQEFLILPFNLWFLLRLLRLSISGGGQPMRRGMTRNFMGVWERHKMSRRGRISARGLMRYSAIVSLVKWRWRHCCKCFYLYERVRTMCQKLL